MSVYGYRELLGCIPVMDNPSKFRLFWRMPADHRAIFFTQTWIDAYKRWVPCDSAMRIVSGGTRQPLYDNDRAVDSLHNVTFNSGVLSDQSVFVFQIEVKDHRSFQRFDLKQLSNYEGEEIADAVEEWTRPDTK